MMTSMFGALRWRTLPSWIAAIVTTALIATMAVAMTATKAHAIATAVPLGTADSFAVLAGQTVTNTGPSVVTGDLGVSPGTAITGFPPGTVNGAIHSADAVALQAQSDLTVAYNNAAGQAPDASIAGDLGGLTLTPGVYNASSSIGLTGTLTLDAQGDPNAVWIFQVGSTLTTASASRVLLVNGAAPCNVFWQIGSSATIGTNTAFVGNILALTSITLNTGASVNGRALARNGSVSMDTNTVTRQTCAATTGGTTTGTTTTGGTTGTTTTGGTTGTTTTGGTTSGTTGGLLGGSTGGLLGGVLGGVLGGITTGGLTTGGITGAITTGGTTSGGITTGGVTVGNTTGGATVGTTSGNTMGNTAGNTTGGGLFPPPHFPPPHHGGNGDHHREHCKPCQGDDHHKHQADHRKPCKPRRPAPPKHCKPKHHAPKPPKHCKPKHHAPVKHEHKPCKPCEHKQSEWSE